MRKIKKIPSRLPNHANKKEILLFLGKYKKIFSFFTEKKRPIFLEKYLIAQEGRRDKSSRFSCFFPCIELVKNASSEDVRQHGPYEWEIVGVCTDGSICAAHIREELLGKDRILFLISTFEKT